MVIKRIGSQDSVETSPLSLQLYCCVTSNPLTLLERNYRLTELCYVQPPDSFADLCSDPPLGLRVNITVCYLLGPISNYHE